MSNEQKWLRLSKNVEGPRWVENTQGVPCPLFGMARSHYEAQSEEDPKYGGIRGLCQHFKSAGCNSIRLAVRATTNFQRTLGDLSDIDLVEECGGYNETGIKKWIEKYVNPDVEAIINSGMYVMLDLHEYPPGFDHPRKTVEYAREHYIPLWRELAKFYRDEPMIAVFELWNEPYPADQMVLRIPENYNWIEDIRNFFIDCAAAVREIDDKHILLVSDYNAGWGDAWETCWKGYTRTVDPIHQNTAFSIHVAKEHLDDRFKAFFEKWWTSIGSLHNSCIIFGEIETEGVLMNKKGIENLIKLFLDYESTHHFSGYLWRPHDDESNYVDVWKDFARNYAKQI